jgi:hypothetical protein
MTAIRQVIEGGERSMSDLLVKLEANPRHHAHAPHRRYDATSVRG